MGARRHEELARALRRRLVEDRRLELPEAAALQVAADGLRERRAHPDVVAHAVAAQVEVAVTQPKRLVDTLLPQLAGQHPRRRKELEAVDVQLHLAGREARVDRLGAARAD